MRRALGMLVVGAVLATVPAAAQEAPAAPSSPSPATPPAVAQPAPPSSGTVWIVLGSVALGAGTFDLATTPLCKSSSIRLSAQPACLGVSLAVGLSAVAGGIAFVVVGVRKRSAFLTWQKETGLTVAPIVGGAGATLAWKGSF